MVPSVDDGVFWSGCRMGVSSGVVVGGVSEVSWAMAGSSSAAALFDWVKVSFACSTGVLSPFGTRVMGWSSGVMMVGLL